jgi:hypothetical protein
VEPDSEANETLKMTEGHLHNSWKTSVESVGDRAAAQLARSVLDKINEQVRLLRKKIRPEAEAVDIPVRAFRKVFNQKGTSAGASTGGEDRREVVQRDFVIRDVSRTGHEFNPKRPTELKANGTARIGLRQDHKLSEMEVTIDLGWAVYEESGPKRDNTLTDESSVSLPQGFVLEDGALKGKLTKELVELSWKSLYFPDDWRVAPDPRVSQAVRKQGS